MSLTFVTDNNNFFLQQTLNKSVSQDEGHHWTWKLASNQSIVMKCASEAMQNEWSHVPVCTYRQDEESMPISLLRHLDVILLWGNTECWQLHLLRWRNYIACPTHTICAGDEMLRAHFCCARQYNQNHTASEKPLLHKHTKLKIIVFITFCSTNTHSDQQRGQKWPQTHKTLTISHQWQSAEL